MTDFQGSKYFHLRRQYFNSPSRYGITFNSDEVSATKNALAVIQRIDRPIDCDIKVHYTLRVRCTPLWTTFYRNDTQSISLRKDTELDIFRLALVNAYSIMGAGNSEENAGQDDRTKKDSAKEMSTATAGTTNTIAMKTRPETGLTCPFCYSDLTNHVCAGCGYVGLYSDIPELVL